MGLVRKTFLLGLLLIGIGFASPSVAQPVADIPLTHDAFRGLTVEQAARRLIGPSAELVSKMIVGGFPGNEGAPLSEVRFFATPRIIEAGLCQQNEIDVFFETEDGSRMGQANASTRMKISEIRTRYGFFAVGEMNIRLREPQRSELERVCAGVSSPLAFFRADSGGEAWEAAHLATIALKEAKERGRQALNISCSATKCDDAFESLSMLSPKSIFAVRRGCNREPDARSVCYSIDLVDPLNPYRSWLVYVESDRRNGVGPGPDVIFRKATFSLNPQAVI
jgi:hypothetical protein